METKNFSEVLKFSVPEYDSYRVSGAFTFYREGWYLIKGERRYIKAGETIHLEWDQKLLPIAPEEVLDEA